MLLESVYPPGTSATAAAVTSAKLASLSGVESDAAYVVLVAQVAEQQALEIAAFDAEIRKREADRETAFALRVVERLERERVAAENFANEKKRRHDRLEELDREKASPSGYKIQSANENNWFMKIG